MALEKCADAITKALGRELTPEERKAVARDAEAVQAKVGASGGDWWKVNDILNEHVDRMNAQAAIAKRTTAMNYTALARKTEYRQSTDFIDKNPAEGFIGMMRGSLYDYPGSKASLAAMAQHESSARTAAFHADLDKAGLFKYAFSGTDDDNIGQAQIALRAGKDASQFGSQAAAVAKILEDHQEVLRQDLNSVGAAIDKNSDRLFRRTHDAYKIARAGNNPFGSEAAFQSWAASLKLDWNKSFDGTLAGATDTVKLQRLRSLWNQFVSNTHLNFGDNTIGRGVGNIANKFGAQRELVFADPKDDIAYNKQYGRGNSIAENVYHALSDGGKRLGIMREWGPNPEQNLTEFKDRWLKQLNDANRPADMAKLDKTFKSEMGNTWKLLTSQAGHPNDNFVSRTLSTIRSVTNTAALGMSIFSSIGDLPLRASQLNMAGDRTSGEFFKGLATSTGRMLDGSGLTGADKQRLAAEAGIRLENANLPLDPNLTDHVGFGQIAKFNQQVLKMAGHSFWSNRIRTNSLAADGFQLHGLKDTAFNDLPVGKQALFRQFGITDKGWDIIRRSEPSELDNGWKVLTPSALADMDPSEFKSLAGDAASRESMARSQGHLQANFRNMLGEMADRSTSAPSIGNRAFMGMGRYESGTIGGELYRGAMQLKGFVFNYMRNHLGREIYGYSQDKMTFPQAMAKLFTSQPGASNARAGLAKLIAAGVGFSYMGNYLRDIATGKTPENPVGDHWGHVMQRALARQSLGIYSDFIFAEANPNASFWDRVGDMTGPELGLASNAFNLAHGVYNHATKVDGYSDDDFYKDAQKGLSLAYRNTPGTSLFWTKYAMDYLILNNLSDQINPGYSQRLQEAAAKKGQTYLMGASPQ